MEELQKIERSKEKEKSKAQIAKREEEKKKGRKLTSLESQVRFKMVEEACSEWWWMHPSYKSGEI